MLSVQAPEIRILEEHFRHAPARKFLQIGDFEDLSHEWTISGLRGKDGDVILFAVPVNSQIATILSRQLTMHRLRI